LDDENLWKLIERRRAHELLMRPRGFNWHRLWLVKNPTQRFRFPPPLEWLLSCIGGAALVAAYFWWVY